MIVGQDGTTVKYRMYGSSLGSVNQSTATASSSSSLGTVKTLNNLYPSNSLSVLPAASPNKPLPADSTVAVEILENHAVRY